MAAFMEIRQHDASFVDSISSLCTIDEGILKGGKKVSPATFNRELAQSLAGFELSVFLIEV